MYVAITTPYPGTDLYELANSRGMLASDDWSSYDHLFVTGGAVLNLETMSHSEVVAAKGRIESFFLEYSKSYKRSQLIAAVLDRGFLRRSIKMMSSPSRAVRFINLAFAAMRKSGYSVVQ